MPGEVDTRQSTVRTGTCRLTSSPVDCRPSTPPASACLALKVVKDGDAQAVKLTVGALGHHLVEDARPRVVVDPPGQHLAELVAVLGLGRREYLCPHHGSLSLAQRWSGSRPVDGSGFTTGGQNNYCSARFAVKEFRQRAHRDAEDAIAEMTRRS